MLDGVKLVIGGREFIVPPLNFKLLKKYLPRIEKLGEEKDLLAVMEFHAEVLLAALQRNYPDITAEELDNLLDFTNSQDVIAAIMGASGLKLTKGEPLAGSGLTGANSTLTS